MENQLEMTGITTDSSLFNDYFKKFSYDEMIAPDKQINVAWGQLLFNIKKIGKHELNSRQSEIDWHLPENGVTYNVYNDPAGIKRPWQLNAIPFVLNENEWVRIEQGIKQRAELMNLILKDIYGKRELISKGIVPLEVIYGHRGFIRSCDQIKYTTPKYLHIYAADIARGPDGQMWIINDRTQAPSGMGYALENRLTMGRVLPDMFVNLHVKKLSGFFHQFKEMLNKVSPKNKENPSIVVLTPGPHNETYFEHAYLASFLGLPLVQGNHLVARNGYLWLKSLKGLRQVDVVLRRVDDLYCDPLELRSDSFLGIAGLLDVVRKQNVTLINPIGSSILENSGLIPFIPNIAKYFLNERLILPQIATWWCGQPKELKYVIDNLGKLIIKNIDRSGSNYIFVGEQLTTSEMEDLKNRIKQEPHLYVGQEKVSFSTSPTFEKGGIEPRNSVCRAYSIANEDNYEVMPGGLVRVATGEGNLFVSNQKGGSSKDLWVLSKEEEIHNTPVFLSSSTSKVLVPGLEDLPSLTAENFFWAGRYVGRALSVARFARMVLRVMTDVNQYERQLNSSGQRVLYQAITHLTSTYPGFAGVGNGNKFRDPQKEILSVILDKEKVGSLSYTLAMLSNACYSLRNLWSADTWRVFEGIETKWRSVQQRSDNDIKNLIYSLDQLITSLIAFMGLVEESILLEQGLLLYFIGLRLEESMLGITINRSLLVIKQEVQVEYEILEALLNSNESLNIYRYTYRSHLRIENLIDLVLLDLKYPRSVGYKLNRLIKDLAELPHSGLSNHLADYEKPLFEAFTKLRLSESSQLCEINEGNIVRIKLDKLLGELTDLLFLSAKSLSNTYFSHANEQTNLTEQINPF